MGKPDIKSAKATIPGPGIFSLLKPYSGIVILLIIMALLGSGINILIPKIIARGIDAFSAGHSDIRFIVYQFLAAAAAIFIFTSLQNIIQTYASERVGKRFAHSSSPIKFPARVMPMFLNPTLPNY